MSGEAVTDPHRALSSAEVIARLMRAASYSIPMLSEEDLGTDVERFFDLRRVLYGEYRRRMSFGEAAFRADRETVEAIMARDAYRTGRLVPADPPSPADGG